MAEEVFPVVATRPFPTLNPTITPAPTLLPSPVPTAADVVTVEISMKLKLSSVDQLSEEMVLEVMLALLPGVDLNMVKRIIFTPVPAERRRLHRGLELGGEVTKEEENSDASALVWEEERFMTALSSPPLSSKPASKERRRRRLGLVEYVVSVEVRAPLSELDFATADEMQSGMEQAMVAADASGALTESL